MNELYRTVVDLNSGIFNESVFTGEKLNDFQINRG